MGMYADRRNAAAGKVSYCEQAFKESKNPFYVVAALDAALWGELLPPEWALSVLLDANRSAMLKHYETGEKISIDAALGLSVGRGQRQPEKRAKKEVAERPAFKLVKTIHVCFEAPVPIACEMAYYAIAREFAFQWQEAADFFKIGIEWEPSWCDWLSREEWSAKQVQDRGLFENEVATSGECSAVKEKLVGLQWWRVSHGDRFNYSLDHFIERYYRLGTKLEVQSGRVGEQQMLLMRGSGLLMTPDECTSEIIYKNDGGYALEAVSALRDLKMRPEFEAFHQRLSEIGKGSGRK